jgi:chromosome segregation ATPase
VIVVIFVFPHFFSLFAPPPSPTMNRNGGISHSSNNNNNGQFSTAHNSQDVSIEAKLQGFEANLRREREEARRQAELATERLRLVQEEVTATEKTVHDLQGKLKHLQHQYGSSAAQDLSQLQASVQSLTKEVSVYSVLSHVVSPM